MSLGGKHCKIIHYELTKQFLGQIYQVLILRKDRSK